MKNKTAQANIRYLRISPRKVRPVIDLIRGKSLEEAKAILLNLSKKASSLVLKALESASANAKAKNLEIPKLFIKEIRADEGPAFKRFKPWSRGTVRPIRKRTTHLSIILEEKEEFLGKIKEELPKISEKKETKEERKESKSSKKRKFGVLPQKKFVFKKEIFSKQKRTKVRGEK